MQYPPFKCLFCLQTDVTFSRVEHPIPESLGNDEWTLPPGFVCDSCNQYFGSKVESKVISEPPFIVERLGYVVKSKKGRVPKYKVQPGLHIAASGFKDLFLVIAEEDYVEQYRTIDNNPFWLTVAKGSAFYLSRFLLKIGLESLVGTQLDPYSSAFDNARAHARRGAFSTKWQIGYAIYPSRKDLEISTRYDEFGPLDKRQLYEYGIGVLPSGDVSMSLVYGQHIFACNLSRPSIVEHLMLFNTHNSMTMHFYHDASDNMLLGI